VCPAASKRIILPAPVSFTRPPAHTAVERLEHFGGDQTALLLHANTGGNDRVQLDIDAKADGSLRAAFSRSATAP
jgi:hypothetical protein